ncbi:hydrogenase maturation protease [Mycolicibacterium confluentis]|uniref:Peptidase M52 n=1 Tax=Mycolicibacterium confluentis TaxID=28047 RepID=A0A7I7XUN7_9MYCO|nr:hydrogenase maturation protease [Mycolicibacterium confluentis]MCV7322315.1 hydrogenase maturation protease [Mycolicibacterium confluentis]ORV28365.1 hypothetical protein AWB99_17670 [Mycolicibacterium confluentis]BBZ33000.1 peptidase M52 [Mycolicibacterium confluentis]
MTPRVVVIGLGNAYRRDDGVGLAVADEVARTAPPDVGVHAGVRDSSQLLDLWVGAEAAILVDATVGPLGEPGRIRRITPDAVATTRTTSSHGLDVAAALALGETLRRNPSRVVLYTVDVADCGYGIGLTSDVAATVPAVAAAVIAEARAATAAPCGTARHPR